MTAAARRVALVAALALLASGCGGSGGGGSTSQSAGSTTTAGTTTAAATGTAPGDVGAILSRPGTYVNDTVVVAGAISRRIGPKAFTISGGTSQQTIHRQGLLVLGVSPPAASRLVKVTGRVIVVSTRTAKLAGLPQGTLGRFVGKGAIDASKVVPVR